jgi:hypothetical protein
VVAAALAIVFLARRRSMIVVAKSTDSPERLRHVTWISPQTIMRTTH